MNHIENKSCELKMNQGKIMEQNKQNSSLSSVGVCHVLVVLQP
jgi:hypothetical protein